MAKTGAVGELEPAHPGDILRGTLQDGGPEAPGCWTTVMRRQEGAILTKP